jgi:predicted outer membrane repeat protein
MRAGLSRRSATIVGPVALAVTCMCSCGDALPGRGSSSHGSCVTESGCGENEIIDSGGTGDSASEDEPVDADGDGWLSSHDCDDEDATVHPRALEVCNGRDDDCDQDVDEDDTDLQDEAWVDMDGDGFAGTLKPTCDGEPQGSDCDDADPAIHPGAVELLCDSVDSDCDGLGAESVAVVGGVEFQLVESALAAAVDGDTMKVCPGSHTSRLIVPTGMALTVESWSGDAGDTELDGDMAGTILYMEYGSNVTVQNLTFARGRAEDWYAGEFGGAIANIGGELVVNACVFVDNVSAHNGGAIAVASERQGDPAGVATLTVSDSLFTGSYAGYSGGAVVLDGWNGTTMGFFENCSFIGNEAAYEGGGLLSKGWSLVFVDVLDTLFFDNHAQTSGGAVALASWGDVDVSFLRVDMDANSAVSHAAGMLVGSRVREAVVTFEDSSITNNVCTTDYPAGVSLNSTTTLYSISTDWGVGVADNYPGDLQSHGGYYDTLGVGETFTCSPFGVCE